MKGRKADTLARLIGIPLVALLAKLSRGGFDLSILSFLQYGVALAVTAYYWLLISEWMFYLRRRFPQVIDSVKRILLAFGGGLVLVIALNFTAPFLVPAGVGIFDETTFSYMAMCSLIDLAIVALVLLVYETIFFYRQWSRTSYEAEQLKMQQLKSQVNALKTQLSPHFLFNSLNTLLTLIHEDSHRAAKFTEKLSEVYRYILQSMNAELVPLREELKFTRNFLYLLNMRFGDNLHVDIDVADRNMADSVPPMTVQMLIENAVKHNTVGTQHPLHVKIYIDTATDRLVVTNRLQLKRMVKDSTQTGLENIQKRYQLLSDRRVEVVKTAESFTVSLPIIRLHTSQLSVSTQAQPAA